MKDYYKVLNVSSASTTQAIKKSYRKLATQFHPDKNKTKGAEEKFKQISEAYNILSHAEKRKTYDEQRKAQNSYSSHPLYSSAQKNSYNYSQQPFSQAHTTPKKPSSFQKPELLDAFTQLNITLEEAHIGCEKQIVFQRKKMNIKIPRGIQDGKKLRLIGQNHQFKRKKGDLFVEIKIKKHPLFKLDQQNIIMTVPISISDAILGSQITIPTLTNQAQVSIRPGIQSGSLLILKNQGFFHEDGSRRGDLILEIHIDIPAQITEEERQWFKKFKLKETLPPSVAQFNIQARKLLLNRAA